MNNTQQNIATRAGFYSIAAKCMKNSGQAETSANLTQTMTFLINQATFLGRAIGMNDEAIRARLKLAQQDQMKSMNENCINISIVLVRHLD